MGRKNNKHSPLQRLHEQQTALANQIAATKAALQDARQRQRRTGKYLRADAYETLQKQLKQYLQAYVETSRQLREMEKHRPTLAERFMAVAQQTLDEELYDSLVELAQRRWE